MAINYTVLTDVIDIRTDIPQPTDEFLVDTNVWYWLVYTRASLGSNPPRTRQLTNYPGYVNQALANGSRIRQCGLTLSELAHRIEQTEREIYGQAIGVQPPPTKEFRHNFPAQRSNVVSEVQAAWAQVTSMASSLDITLNDGMTTAAVLRFQTEALDGYDLFLLEAAAASGVAQVITDDGDFCGVPGLQMFTDNQSVLTAAQAQGKLIVR